MAIDINHFIQLRPYLYHLTGQQNVSYIQKDMVLKPAGILIAEAGENALNRKVRRGKHVIRIGEREVYVRDQDPLFSGNIHFADGWTIEDFVEYLNRHVFFWPGWNNQPVKSGSHHFKRYAEEEPRPRILRVAAKDLFAANNGIEPLFCQYNSGAPRCSRGYKSPRSTRTFVTADNFALSVCRVVEVTFRSPVRLPVSVQLACSISGPWRPLLQCV